MSELAALLLQQIRLIATGVSPRYLGELRAENRVSGVNPFRKAADPIPDISERSAPDMISSGPVRRTMFRAGVASTVSMELDVFYETASLGRSVEGQFLERLQSGRVIRS